MVAVTIARQRDVPNARTQLVLCLVSNTYVLWVRSRQVAGRGVWSWYHLTHHGQKASWRWTVWREVLTYRTFLIGSLSTLVLSTNVTQQDAVTLPLFFHCPWNFHHGESTVPTGKSGWGGQGTLLSWQSSAHCVQEVSVTSSLIHSSEPIISNVWGTLLTAGAFNMCKLRTRSRLTWQK